MRSVVVCGSKKYNKEVAAVCRELEAAGVMVFEPSIQQPIFEDEKIHSDYVTAKLFKGLTLEHLDWIRKADVCYVYNKDGYVGVSVTMEMAYAAALGKPVFAFSPETGDPCRDSLIDKVLSPKQLVGIL
jgi:nucleoside 2-deoxyribosyltransferase